jgi:hypothetical protein
MTSRTSALAIQRCRRSEKTFMQHKEGEVWEVAAGYQCKQGGTKFFYLLDRRKVPQASRSRQWQTCIRNYTAVGSCFGKRTRFNFSAYRIRKHSLKILWWKRIHIVRLKICERGRRMLVCVRRVRRGPELQILKEWQRLRAVGLCDDPGDKSVLSSIWGYWYFYAAFVSLLRLNSVAPKTGMKSP